MLDTVRNVIFNPLYITVQGAVTSTIPVEPSVTGIKIFDLRKFVLIA